MTPGEPQPAAPQSGTVLTGYQALYPDPIAVRAGEAVAWSGKTDNWQGHTWVWCTDARGKSGWVPQPYLAPQGDGWIIPVDYNATELSVHTGDTVTITAAQSGWCWCTGQNGQTGWVPAANLTITPPPDDVI